MRRVVVTGMGIVSSIGNNAAGSDWRACARRGRASPAPTATPNSASAARCRARRRSTPEEIVDRRAMRFHGGGTAWNHVAMDQAIRDSGLEPGEVSNERTGIIMGSGGPSTRAIVEAADIARAKGPKRVGPFAVPKSMCSTASATLVDLVQDQGRQLFDLLGLRDLQPLHRRGVRTDPARQAGRDVRRRLRGAGLDAVGAVRRDGRDVVAPTTTRPSARSRAYDKNRDGFVISGGAGRAGAGGIRARQGARREHLRRDRRLWRDFRRRRHGRALRRRRGALHAQALGDGEDADRLHQPARDLDPGRRPQGDRGDPRGVRLGRQMPADLGDQVAHRPFARARPACTRRSIRC